MSNAPEGNLIDKSGNIPEIGDRVICIDASASFNRLVLGGEYVVSKAYDGTPTVEVNGSTHCMDRFVKKAEVAA